VIRMTWSGMAWSGPIRRCVYLMKIRCKGNPPWVEWQTPTSFLPHPGKMVI
jgi:hypothetical protein